MINIIGDVAGQYDALMRLIKKMPKDDFIFVGDLIDRGPKSKEVVEWVMKNALCVKGNHEDMMVDFYRNINDYGTNIWFMNGGDKTMESYGCKLYSKKVSNHDIIRKFINEEHIIWMENLPIYYSIDGLLVSHAPYLEDNAKYDYKKRIWYREIPDKLEGHFNIFGHNSHWGLMKIKDYAMCIDASASNVLTGVNWPSLTIYQEPYE